MEEHIVNGIMMAIFILMIAVFSSIFLKKINFPYTIGLVVVGIIFGLLAFRLEFLAPFSKITLSPDLILYIILPTLIFDAAIDIDSSTLRKNIVPILLLAVLGLLLSTGVIGIGLSLLTPLSLIGALVFGALISATDPVAVVALFREIGAPKRLMTLIDGESLFNDATAIVLFTILITPFTSSSAEQITFIGAMIKFTIVLAGGLGVGIVIGILGAKTLNIEKDNLLLQITVSLLMAYISFIVADHFLKVSGVMSTLAAGLVFRSRAEIVIKRSNIETVEHFWDYFTFVANSFVFILLGLSEIHILRNSGSPLEVLITFISVTPVIIIARATGIYILIPLYNRLHKNSSFPISLPYQTVLFWGGLRGAVPVALVLAIPVSFPSRELIIHYTMGFILFTLLVQGTTIKALMDKLNIKPDKSAFDDHKTLHRDYSFGTEKLAELILNGMRKMFEDEGFFIREQSSEDLTELLLKRGKMTLIIQHSATNLGITAEPNNIAYLNTVLYETILELKSSVDSLKDASNPENLQKLVEVDKSETSLSFDIMQYIKPDLITAELVSNDKESVLKEMVAIFKHHEVISDFQLVFDEIMERENSMSTGMGMEIAMPHTRTDSVSKLTALIGVCSEGVDFKALDGKNVKIFVMILSPKSDSGPHLQFLAAISKILINEDIREKIIESGSAAEIYRIIEEAVRRD
jgi:Na+/H+ antiporter